MGLVPLSSSDKIMILHATSLWVRGGVWLPGSLEELEQKQIAIANWGKRAGRDNAARNAQYARKIKR